MRIARIIEYFPPHIGGMERHGLILTKEQIKLGHEVDIFIGYGDQKLLSSIYKMPIQFLSLYSRLRRIWFNTWAYFAVKKSHKNNPYNIIHFHGDFVEAFFGGKISKKINVPAILTIHAGLNKKFLKPKNAKYFKNISKIICVSQEIADDLKSVGVPSNKLTVISSGIYLSEFQKTDENKVGDLRNQYSKPIIISVGVLRPAKGFKYLIGAFKKIKEKFSEVTLIIIGDGPDKIELEKQSKNINGIYFLGRKDNSNVIEYLKSADIFVLAAISMVGDREGTSNSIMEAMAVGLPVVTTKVGGNPYLVKEGINGFLIEEKNSNELAEVVIKLIDNSEIREKMKIKNIEDIKQKDWPIITKLVIEVYESVLPKT
jgi:glycosyltransferase involved in cell wall biosynthesis